MLRQHNIVPCSELVIDELNWSNNILLPSELSGDAQEWIKFTCIVKINSN